MKFVVDKYAIDKTQVDYILKSDKAYLYLSNALEYTRINIKSNINRYFRNTIRLFNKYMLILS